MNIIDVFIILIILAGAALGFKRGFTKEVICFLGFIAVVVCSFLLKNPISIFLYENLPFFKFAGIFKGVTVLNIILYEVIAFLIVFAILMIILRVIMLATSLFEKILNATIILGIPSKLLGAVVGCVHYFVLVFIILYVVSLPMFNIAGLEDSKLRSKILNETPILSSYMDKTLVVFNEFVILKDKYEVVTNPMEFNKEALNVLLKYNVVTVESIDKLVEKKKLQIDNIEGILKPYRKEV